jgi:hemerythrin-like domain-containing protein
MSSDRRQFILSAAIGGGMFAAQPELLHSQDQDSKARDEDEEEVSPAEDLMREHGVLNRVLLIYEEGLRRLRAKEDLPPKAFQGAASLVRTFVEDYHEKLEEDSLFPAFEKRKKQLALVATLRKQHQAGRRLTEAIQRESAHDRFGKEDNRKTLITSVEAFIRMYRPHEAREDTVLFPALPSVFTSQELKDLGEQFEEKEHKLFGDEGFQSVVAQVAEIEKQLSIHDLDLFTPR